jgi:hypothetical protein
MRWIALLVLLAVLPTAELGEQLVHVVEHLIEHDPADHSAHHDALHGDEHGCTGLVHLCACHHVQVTLGTVAVVTRSIEAARSMTIALPGSLVNLTSPEPEHRPPIV